MTKEKLLKMSAYEYKVQQAIIDAPQAKKHLHNQKEYLAFLNKELSMIKGQIASAKLAMTEGGK